MIEYFEKNWWLWSLRGVIAVIFGFVALSMPNLTLTSMVLLFSAFIFSDGIFALLTLFARKTEERWSWQVFLKVSRASSLRLSSA